MRHKLLKAGVAVGALALVLSACGGSSGGGGGTGSSGVLRIGSDSTIDSLNPFVGFNQLSYATYQVTYPYLVQYASDLSFKPYFATSWSTSSDGKDWTFKLVPNAKWSDGQPLDATDVAWNFNTLVKYQSNGTGNWSGTIAHLKNATVTDPTTVVLHYQKAVANVLSQLQQVPIVPSQFWQQYITGGKADFKSVKMTPPLISGGPYKLTSFSKDASATLAVNTTFWGSPKPTVTGIGIQMYKNDDAMIGALKSGDLDLIESLPSTGVKPVTADFNVNDHASTFFYDFIFNSNPQKTNNRELLNPKVKEAFAYAFNLQQMIDTLWLGHATMGASVVPPATDAQNAPWSDPNVKALPYNPTKANQILDKLGYKKGSNGIRIADGHPMAYDIIMPSDLTAGDRMFQLIQGWLKAIGVQVTQKNLDASAAFDAIGAPNYTYKNFDLAIWDWIMLPDPDFALSVVTCAEYGNWSDTGYCNPAYDKLYALQGTQTNLQDRINTVYKMQEILNRDRPYIILGYQNWVSAYAKNWTGFADTIQGPVNALSVDGLVDPHKT